MNDMIKTALIAGGAYLLYRQFAATPAVAAAAGSSSAGAATITPSATTAQPTQINLRASLAAWAAGMPGSPALLSMDQWCVGYAGIKGVPCPDPVPLFPQIADRGTPMTIDTFLAGMSRAGLAGLWGRW